MNARTTSSVATTAQQIARVLLALLLLGAGVAHLVRPEPFEAQVPPWFPAPAATILISGLIEIGLGAALLVADGRRAAVGWTVAAFFLLIFPGNISQFATGTDAFGLNSGAARGVRLLLQPVLIAWALWCTGAWAARRSQRKQRPGAR